MVNPIRRPVIKKRPQQVHSIFLGFFLFLSIIIGFGGTGFAAQVILAWDPNSEPDLAGYRIYVGYQSRVYAWNLDAGLKTQATLGGLVEGTPYFLSITAYNHTGLESGFSNEVSYTPAGSSYSLAITPTGNGGGYVSTNPSGSSFNPGTTVTLSALPDSRSLFSGWGGACSGTSTSCQVTMNANLSATANFTLRTFTLTASAGSNGSITPTGSQTVSSGGNAAFTITPNTGYRIADVRVDGTSVGTVSSYTFEAVSANHTISATFVAQSTTGTYTLRVNKTGSGTGTIAQSPPGQRFSYGTLVTLNALPSSDSAFAGWTGACTGTAPTCTVTMNARKTVTATFTKKTYTLTASAGSNGAITPSGDLTVTHGASQSYAITAASGFRITDVRVDQVSVGPVTSYTFDHVAANHQIEASFIPKFDTPINYALHVSQNGTGRGSIWSSLAGTNFIEGTEITLTAVPNENSLFAGWSGACAGNETECRVVLNGDRFVTATFNAKAVPLYQVFLPTIIK